MDGIEEKPNIYKASVLFNTKWLGLKKIYMGDTKKVDYLENFL